MNITDTYINLKCETDSLQSAYQELTRQAKQWFGARWGNDSHRIIITEIRVDESFKTVEGNPIYTNFMVDAVAGTVEDLKEFVNG